MAPRDAIKEFSFRIVTEKPALPACPLLKAHVEEALDKEESIKEALQKNCAL